MAIVELESAPESACISEAGMSLAEPMQVEFKLSDELRAEIMAEIGRRVDPEKINLAVRLVHDCPKCRVELESTNTVIVEYRKADGTDMRQQTAFALCVSCADAHIAQTGENFKLLELERAVIDGRNMSWG